MPPAILQCKRTDIIPPSAWYTIGAAEQQGWVEVIEQYGAFEYDQFDFDHLDDVPSCEFKFTGEGIWVLQHFPTLAVGDDTYCELHIDCWLVHPNEDCAVEYPPVSVSANYQYEFGDSDMYWTASQNTIMQKVA